MTNSVRAPPHCTNAHSLGLMLTAARARPWPRAPCCHRAEDDNFSLLGWWKRMATDRPADNWFAWKVLSQLACVYHGIDATSCVAERNFSQLAIKLGPLERDGDPDHVADTLFLKANSQLIPDVQAWNLMRRFLSERGIEAGSTPADIAAACKEFILKHGPTSSSAGE
mmetsp:Transcript_5070/g.12626  ORF Transcript_5070/g.12626 Transcript_5070/m.12626 type:complete len:168 (-) Transcript_5070:295-798(-)